MSNLYLASISSFDFLMSFIPLFFDVLLLIIFALQIFRYFFKELSFKKRWYWVTETILNFPRFNDEINEINRRVSCHAIGVIRTVHETNRRFRRFIEIDAVLILKHCIAVVDLSYVNQLTIPFFCYFLVIVSSLSIIITY
jgi:hypothetical protein